jgi:hypothetical protein
MKSQRTSFVPLQAYVLAVALHLQLLQVRGK